MLELGGEETGNEYWDRLNTLAHFTGSKALWRVSLKPTSRLYLDEAAVIDWGGGLRWIVDPEWEVREILKNEDGHATLVKHPVKPAVEIFQPLGQPLQGIHQRLKNRFDPLGIFNPGRMYQDF